MSMKVNIASEAELAKSTVMNSPLDNDTKRNLVTLISKSAMATNGITPEEKIQTLTECMASLASALAIYMSNADSRIEKLELLYKEEHPTGQLERLKKREHELFEVEEYRNMSGIIPNIKISGETIADILSGTKKYIDGKIEKAVEDRNGIVDKIFKLLEKPYVWLFGTAAVCSPFAVDVLNAVLGAFVK